MAHKIKADNGNVRNHSIQPKIMEQKGFINPNKHVNLPDILVPALHKPTQTPTTTTAPVNAINNQPSPKK